MNLKDILTIVKRKMLHDWKSQLLICAIFTLCFLPAIFAVFISTNLETINTKIQSTALKDNILLFSEFTPNTRTAIENKLKESSGAEISDSLRQDGVKSHIKGLELSVSWLWFESKTPAIKNEDTGKNQEISKITLLPASVYAQNPQLAQKLINSDTNKVTLPLLYNSYVSRIATASKNWSTIQADMNNTLNKTFPIYSSSLGTTNKTKQLNPNFMVQFVGYGGGSTTTLGVLTSSLQEKLQQVGVEEQEITVSSVSVLEFENKLSKEKFISKYDLEYDKFEDRISRLLGIVTFASIAIFIISLIILILISARDLLGAKVDLAMFCAMGINRFNLIMIFIINYAVLSLISLLVSVALTVLAMLYLSNFTNLYFDLLGNLITSPESINYITVFTTDYFKLSGSLIAAFGATILPFSLIIIFIQKLNIISTLK